MFNPALQTRRQDTLGNNSQRAASNPYSSREYIQGHINSQPGKNLTNSDSTKNLHQNVSQISLELQPTSYTPHKDQTQQGRHQHSQTHPKLQSTAQQHNVDFRLEERALSPTPSSYNFNNNNAVPKRSSFPKNLDDLDISIKNNIEKIRNVYEKSDQNAEKKRNSSKTKNKIKNDSTKRNSPGKDNGLKSTSYPPFSIKYNNNNNNNGLGESSQYLYQQRSEFDSYLEMDNPQGSSTKMREDFDEKHRKRKRHHLIFLLIVMFIVAVAVLTTVLAATLGTTQGKLPPPVLQNYSVVMANMTLKILNRDFHVDLLQAGSDAFKNLATSYSIELDELFQRSSLSSVYSRNRVLYFRNGSIYATSSITFLDEGLIKSPQDVENVITSAEVAPDWKLDGAIQLGQYVVCRSCAETKLEFLTIHEKPEVKADNLEPTSSTLIGTNHTDIGTTVTSTPLVSGTPTTTSHDLTLASSRVPDSRDSTPAPDTSRPQSLTTASPSTTKSGSDTRATTLKWDTTQPFTTLSVSNITANISSVAVTISCDVYNPTSWTDVILWHTSLADETTSATTRQKLLRLDPSGLTTVSGSYIDRSRAYYDVSDARITIKLTLSKLSCHDDGYVECTVTEASGARISRIGRLEITVPPSPPRLTIPLNVIANTNLPAPITCEADTGYPPWELTLSVKLPNSSLSHSLPTDVETRPNGCTLTMIHKVNNYQPSMAVHGAELTCELKMTDQHSLIDQQVMQVIQANICDGASNASLLPHPYNCSLLVQCLDDRPAVVSCPSNQTNNNVYERCGLAAPDVIFETTTGVINKDLTRLHCSVSTSVIWSNITIAKMTSSTASRDVITVSAQKHPTWLDLNMGGRALAYFRSLTSQNVLEIWIYELKCSDAGRYTCRVQTPSGSIQRAAELKVYERTKTPVISLKGNIVGGDSLSGNTVGGETLSGNMLGGDTMAGNANPTTIRCEAQVGFPEGTLILQQKPRGQTQFQTVPFSNVSTVQVSSCMSSQVGEYLVPPRLNGSVFRCQVLTAVPDLGMREDLVSRS
ncbi:uncharacterized protein LOC131951640 [Physella acuta]|uniref:uncharacterized protein LOC131951640 n=1 Tax=Physella acuta TaxID=109671 RepID=UPI0027DE1094|nr:uncharacterized protein LOC131951640 [Physella acuta]